MTDSFHEEIQEIERLADELGNFLIQNKDNMSHSNVKYMRGLARWVSCYREALRTGLPEGDGLSTHKSAWIAGISDRMKLEAVEMNSLEDRDGDVEAVPEHSPDMKNFIASAQRIIRKR